MSRQVRAVWRRATATAIVALAILLTHAAGSTSSSSSSSSGWWHTFSLIVPATFDASGSECGGSHGYWDCIISAAWSAPAVYDGGVIVMSKAPNASFDTALGEVINATRHAADEVRAQTLHMSAATQNHNRPADRWSSVFGRRRLEVVGVVDASQGSLQAIAHAREYAMYYNVSGIYIANMSSTNITSGALLQRYMDIISGVRGIWTSQPIFCACEFDGAPESMTLLSDGNYCNTSIVHSAAAADAGNVPSLPAYLQEDGFNRHRVARVYTSATSASAMRAATRAVHGSMPYASYIFVTDLDNFDMSAGAHARLPIYWTGLLADITRPWARYGPAYAAGTNEHVPNYTMPWEPRYLGAARTAVDLLMNKSEGVNVYGNRPTYLSLDAGNVTARTQCSSFITRLWQLTYNMSASHFYRWFRSTSPYAEDYHDAIINGTGFVRLYSVDDLMPGDVVAMRYPTWDRGSVTGHAMLVVNVSKRSSDKSPIVSGTEQYDMWVIDSSASYHGNSDTRAPPNTAGGIGMGISRVFASTSSNYTAGQQAMLVRTVGGFNTSLPVEAAVAGYTWSDFSNSNFYGNEVNATRTLVFGRPTFLEMFDSDTAVAPFTDNGNDDDSTTTTTTTPSTTTTTTTAASPNGTTAMSTTAVLTMDSSTTTAPTTTTTTTEASTTSTTTDTSTATPTTATSTTTTTVPNGTFPIPTAAPTALGFARGIRMFTLNYRIAGSSWGSVILQVVAQLRAVVARDIADMFQLRDAQVEVVQVTVGSLVIEADVYADASSSTPEEQQQAAAEGRYVTALHDFAAARDLYYAVNGQTGEPLLTDSVSVSNRATPVPTLQVTPTPDSETETCGFGCQVFIAIVVILGLVLCCVGCYAGFRALQGPSAEEQRQAEAAKQRQPDAVQP